MLLPSLAELSVSGINTEVLPFFRATDDEEELKEERLRQRREKELEREGERFYDE